MSIKIVKWKVKESKFNKGQKWWLRRKRWTQGRKRDQMKGRWGVGVVKSGCGGKSGGVGRDWWHLKEELGRNVKGWIALIVFRKSNENVLIENVICD